MLSVSTQLREARRLERNDVNLSRRTTSVCGRDRLIVLAEGNTLRVLIDLGSERRSVVEKEVVEFRPDNVLRRVIVTQSDKSMSRSRFGQVPISKIQGYGVNLYPSYADSALPQLRASRRQSRAVKPRSKSILISKP